MLLRLSSVRVTEFKSISELRVQFTTASSPYLAWTTLSSQEVFRFAVIHTVCHVLYTRVELVSVVISAVLHSDVLRLGTGLVYALLLVFLDTNLSGDNSILLVRMILVEVSRVLGAAIVLRTGR